jgi:hypothetical protein
MIHEQIAINLQSIGWAFLIAQYAHDLLNAILESQPKAEIIRVLARNFDEFECCAISLDDEYDGCFKIFEALVELAEDKWDSARISRNSAVLILERDTNDPYSSDWPGHNFKDEL